MVESRAGHIVAMGGGGFSMEPDNHLLDDFTRRRIPDYAKETRHDASDRTCRRALERWPTYSCAATVNALEIRLDEVQLHADSDGSSVVVGLCCLYRNPEAVEVILGARVLDPIAEKKRLSRRQTAFGGLPSAALRAKGQTVKIVYTDGACSGNPGPGGWAWVVPNGTFASGSEIHTTNQRMEIRAALEAILAYDGGDLGPGPLQIVSDSKYVVDCFRDGWWEGWLRRGWRNSAKKPVANRDLWEPLIHAVRARGDITFEWVKGHNDDIWNARADELAVEAARNQSGRRG